MFHTTKNPPTNLITQIYLLETWFCRTVSQRAVLSEEVVDVHKREFVCMLGWGVAAALTCRQNQVISV
jgi:hypothetical protein